jgi:hypothetical protein
MADSTTSGLGDLLGLLGISGANPFGGITKSVSQFQRGVTQFLDSVEKFNDTMDQLNQVAARINGILDTVDEPIRVLVPQITRTIRTTDAMVEQIRGPIEKVAPGISRLADTLASPALAAIPRDLGEFMDVLGDLARRLAPLGQLAESAGSMFGLRPLAALRSGIGSRPTAPAPAPPLPRHVPAPVKSPAKSPAEKALPAKKTGVKSPAVKSSTTKPSAKKAPARKVPAKRAPTRG